MAIRERDLFAAQSFDLLARRAVHLDLAYESADLRAVGSSIHAQRAAHASGNSYEAFHPAKIVFRAKRDRTAQVGCSLDENGLPFDGHIGSSSRKFNHDPGKLAIHHQNVRSAAQKTMRDAATG